MKNQIYQNHKMKTHLLFITLILFTACQKRENQEADKLKAENQILKEKITQLENQAVVFKENAPVTLANTIVREITSKINHQKYFIKVSYPKSYFKNKDKKYPVLYVLDAETNFGGISYIVQRLIKDRLIPEILVIGIAYNTSYKNFYRLRSRDLTPVEDKNLKMGNHDVDPTGGAPEFSQFIASELFPFVSKNFRVKEKDRAIYGHSYGGLFGSYLLLEKPQLFNKYLLLSPSLWYKDNLLVSQVKTENVEFDQKSKLYMASGELEGRIDDLQVEFIAAIKNKAIKNLSIKSEVVKNETHRTIFGVGFTNELRYIYK